MIHNRLLINHLPIFATLFGAILILVSLFLKSQLLRITAFSLLLIGGASFYPAFETGEGAHHEIEKRAGFDKKTHDIMHEHEERAEFAMPFGLGLALLALVGLILDIRKSKYASMLGGVVGVLAIVVMVLLAQLANTGGQISHPELRKEKSK
jgi:hypothetical protein